VRGARFRQVVVGRAFTMGVTTEGAAFGWGDNSLGALGNGATTKQRGPVSVSLPDGVTVVDLTARWGSVFALGCDGHLYGWGDNSFGQLADGSTEAAATPLQIATPSGARITKVAAGYWHGLAVSSVGEVYAWGDNSAGQLGLGSTDDVDGLVAVPMSRGLMVTRISGGGMHSLALTVSGEVYAWGDNSYGQLGDGTTHSRSTPLPVRLPSDVTFVQVAALANASLALASDGRVYAWGDNAFGQLGDGTTVGRPLPIQSLLPRGLQIRQISGGSVHALALDADGGLYTWGHSHSGHSGGSVLGDRSVPVQVLGRSRAAFAQISAGFAHSAGVSAEGELLSWGADWSGQLPGESLPARAVAVGEQDAAKDATVSALGARAGLGGSRADEPARWVYVDRHVKANAG
jgi:alpha-tubulin suppressor-like RCC1 family protein